MDKTNKQFDEIIEICRNVYVKKLRDYGTAWRVLRPESLTDQLFIKAQRIRSIEVKGKQKVDDDIQSEFIGLVNYSVMALIQLEIGFAEKVDTDNEKAIEMYDKYIQKAKDLMLRKNHDYGEAWRNMRVSSFTDLILMKIFRIKQIEDNDGKTEISEGVDANYYDIINYSIFALIKLLLND